MKTIKTVKELKKAIEQKEDHFVVEGKLASDLKKLYKIKKLTPVAIIALAAAIPAAPITGGLSLTAAAPIATVSGLEVAAIILAASLGFTMIYAIIHNYNVKFSGNAKENSVHAEFSKADK